MTQPIGVDVLAILFFFAAGAGAMWLYMLAGQAAMTERERAGAQEISRLYKWLKEKDERLAKFAIECEMLRVSTAESHAIAAVEKESLERERSSFDEDRKRLEETFRSIGTQIIDSNTQKLVNMSRSVLEHQQLTAKIELETLVTPITQTLVRIEEELRAVEHARSGDREALKSGLELLGKLLSAWRANAQEQPNGSAGGRAAEIVLKRNAESPAILGSGPKAFENPSVAEIGETLREYSSSGNRFAVRFQYPDLNAKSVAEREVEPYGVIERYGSSSLIGFDRGRQAWRLFEIEKFASKPVKAGKCTIERIVPDRFNFSELADAESKNGKSSDVPIAVTAKEATLPRHADGGKPVNMLSGIPGGSR
jgi:hypothetical protein